MAPRLPRSLAYRAARALAHRAPGLAPAGPHRPVFIVGSPRSGTTLLLRSLAAHSALAVYPSEGNDLWYPHTYPRATAPVAAPLRWLDPDGFQQVSARHFGADDARRIRAAFATYQRLQGGATLVNKSGGLALLVPTILDLFPDARFLHLVRDGRAVACSYAQKERAKLSGDPDAASVSDPLRLLEAMAAYWARQIDAVDRVAADRGLVGDGRFLEVRYERLCTDPGDTLDHIAEFLGIDPTAFDAEAVPAMRPRSGTCLDDLHPADRRRIEAAFGPTLEGKGYVRTGDASCGPPT